MNNKKVIIVAVIILTIASIIAGIYAIKSYKKNNGTTKDVTSDEIKFKTEYEFLNDKEENNFKHNKIVVNKNNGITYISDTDLLRMINDQSGVVFIGNNNDELSRVVIDSLMTARHEVGLKTIYYLDITTIQSELALGKKNKIKTIKKGTDSYYELLKKLDEYLKPYILYDGDKEIDTLEKRINIPVLIAFNKGNIIGIHEGSVSTHMLLNNPYVLLSNSEKQELVTTYSNIMKAYLESK